MSIVQFKRPEPVQAHSEGTAVCLACRHEWAAVAPVGEQTLDCPSCKLPRGLWKYNFGAQQGDRLFLCLCGSEALTAYQRAGHFYLKCMACGDDHTEAIFG